jgi:hypothetical protein
MCLLGGIPGTREWYLRPAPITPVSSTETHQGRIVKRLTRLGGMLVGAAAAVVGVIWLLKDRITGPPQIPIDEPPPFRVAPPQPASTAGETEPDDLAAVTGIGPVYRARLIEAGFTTFAELAAGDAAAIAEAAGVPESRAADWVEQAAGLADA